MEVVDERVPLARVNDIILYQEDIESLVPKDKRLQDSVSIVTQYVDSWIKKQLTISKASKELDFDKSNIERKILDYRYALMVHEFETHYINQHLDKDISEDEINAIQKDVKSKVQECVDFAEESAYPEVQQLYDMVYEQEDYPFLKHR